MSKAAGKQEDWNKGEQSWMGFSWEVKVQLKINQPCDATESGAFFINHAIL